MKQATLSAIRHLLTAVGAIGVTRGVFTDSQLVEIVGAIIGLVGVIWGPLDEWIAEWKEKHALTVAQRSATLSAVSSQVLTTEPLLHPEDVELLRAIRAYLSTAADAKLSALNSQPSAPPALNSQLSAPSGNAATSS